MRKNFYEINEDIKLTLERGIPSSIMRIDNTAGYVIDCLLKGITPSREFFNEHTVAFECGITPSSVDYAFNSVYPATYAAMLNADILGFVDISGEISRSEWIKEFNDVPTFFADGFLVMDPGALLGYAQKEQNIYIGHLEQPADFEPWTAKLKGKKVLVVSTHRESILSQWNHIYDVWGKDTPKITPFDLVDVIRAPYHPSIDSRQYPECNSWADSLSYIVDQIDKADYDVLLSGATTMSPFLVDHAKRTGKIGIQTGGTIQLFFGIKGDRWMRAPHYAAWNNMVNRYWIDPLKADEPEKRNNLLHLESARAYWR